jgi:hypothetical protein
MLAGDNRELRDQAGLILYPGDDVPASLNNWEPGRPVPMPPGTGSLPGCESTRSIRPG